MKGSTVMKETICVVGLGYIGLPTAIMFANYGMRVHGVDVNESTVQKIQRKEVPIEETGLQERLNRAIDEGMLTVGTTPIEADTFILAVPSPIDEQRKANFNYIRAAASSIVPFLKEGNLVILESTVPPKTVEHVLNPILEKSQLKIGEQLYVAHSPERVIPGRIFDELISNDRIVGGVNEESALRTKKLYETFVEGTIHTTDATTAELVKVMENTYRDVNIAFANELAKIGETLQVDIWEAIRYANFHPRVNIHTPGPGVGGHCIAVDPWFLVELDEENAKLIQWARKTNDTMPEYVAKRVPSILKEDGCKVTVLGLSFKGDVDDMRESPALHVIDALQQLGYEVNSFDPHILERRHETQKMTLEEAMDGSHLAIIVTDHTVFRELDPHIVKQHMAEANIFDTKNIIERARWEDASFHVYRLGERL